MADSTPTPLGEVMPTPDLLRLMVEAGFDGTETHPQSLVRFSTLKFAKLLKEYFAQSESAPTMSESAIHAVLKEMAWTDDCRADAIQLLRAIQNAAPQVPARDVGAESGMEENRPQPAVAAPSITDAYKWKIERDAEAIKTWRLLLAEAHAFLNAEAFSEEDYQEWEQRYIAFRDQQARIVTGVAFVTDTRLGGE